MSTRSDEVYAGTRCAVCEERFTNRDVVAVLWETGERRHYECPTTPDVVMIPEIRIHPVEGWIAIRDRPDSDRPWAKVVPGVSLTDQDVTGWTTYVPDIPPCRLCGGTGERINRLEGYPEPCSCV